MIDFRGEQMEKEFEEAFGFKIEKLTSRQLWWLTKFSKHVRGRCRSNAAFNNYMNANFKPARFKEVTKSRQDGSTYPGLAIQVGDNIDHGSNEGTEE